MLFSGRNAKKKTSKKRKLNGIKLGKGALVLINNRFIWKWLPTNRCTNHEPTLAMKQQKHGKGTVVPLWLVMPISAESKSNRCVLLHIGHVHYESHSICIRWSKQNRATNKKWAWTRKLPKTGCSSLKKWQTISFLRQLRTCETLFYLEKITGQENGQPSGRVERPKCTLANEKRKKTKLRNS